jgi:hypothetical protein
VGSRGGTAQAEWRWGSMRGGRSGGVSVEVVAGVGEVRAPVSGGAVLQLEVEVREVAAARHQSREGKIVGGGEKFGRQWRLRFKGKQWGGGPEGLSPHGGKAGERERERGGAWRSVEQHGGVAVARPWRARAAHCRTTVESGGVDMTRVNMADRWAGTLQGPGH